MVENFRWLGLRFLPLLTSRYHFHPTLKIFTDFTPLHYLRGHITVISLPPTPTEYNIYIELWRPIHYLDDVAYIHERIAFDLTRLPMGQRLSALQLLHEHATVFHPPIFITRSAITPPPTNPRYPAGGAAACTQASSKIRVGVEVQVRRALPPELLYHPGDAQ